MLSKLSRPWAISFSVFVVLACAWVAMRHPVSAQLMKLGGYSDAHLYNDVGDAVDHGRPYYATVAALQRRHRYPLKPFLTFRLPTLAMTAAVLGRSNLRSAAIALLIGSALVLSEAFGTPQWRGENYLIVFTVIFGGAALAHLDSMPAHDSWAGLSITLGLATRLRWREQWWWSVLAIACGMVVREFVAGYALLALAFALAERRWHEATCWLASIAMFGVFLCWHAYEVDQVVFAHDRFSMGWHGGLGISGVITAVDDTTLLWHLTFPLAQWLAILPIVGWLSLEEKSGAFVAALIVGYATMIGIFARADTLYWGAIMTPWYLVGLCLLPRAWRQVAGAICVPSAVIRLP